MYQSARRLSVAAALALASSTALAGDWLWREQIELSPADTGALDIRVGEAIPALEYAPWREQVNRYKLPLRITMPAHPAPSQTAWLWREQIGAPDVGAQRAPLIRMSGSDREGEDVRRQ